MSSSARYLAQIRRTSGLSPVHVHAFVLFSEHILTMLFDNRLSSQTDFCIHLEYLMRKRGAASLQTQRSCDLSSTSGVIQVINHLYSCDHRMLNYSTETAILFTVITSH
jgi:hypothetical protein